jgi:hypothetical protein
MAGQRGLPTIDETTGTTRVGRAVRSARLDRRLSLDVVAGLAGHSKSSLSKVERGLLPLERRSDIARGSHRRTDRRGR